MTMFRYIVSLGLLLILVSVAFCDAPAGLLGQWQDPKPLPPGAHGSAIILDFRSDGTQHAMTRSDGKLLPVRQKNGKEMIVKYSVKGDKMIFTSLDGKHSEEHPFTLQGDVLTFLPSGKYSNIAVMRRLPSATPDGAPPSASQAK